MGGAVSADLAACREVSELVVADVDAVKAERLVAGFDTSRARAIGLDVADKGAALELLEGADVLVNCTSFTMFDSVIDLAVAAGVDYADLISEPSDAQRTAVAEAGITAISGLGASPGLTNVLVRHAADWLDELVEAHLSWAGAFARSRRARGCSTRSSGSSPTTVRHASTSATAVTCVPGSWRDRASSSSRRRSVDSASTSSHIPK